MEMTSRERVLCSLNIKEPDRVPIFEFLYSRPLYKEVLGRVPEYYNAVDVMNCASRIGYDMVPVVFGGVGGFKVEGGKESTYKDEWMVTYQKDTEVTWPVDAPVDFPIKDRQDWKNYVMPDPTIPSRLSEVHTALKMAKDTNLAVSGTVRGPFTAAWLLFGIENFSMLLYDDPEFVDEVISKCTDFFIEGGKRMIQAGIDAIFFADDYGSSAAPLMSPAHFRKHILPHLERMVSSFKKLGAPVIMHSDGNIRPLLDSIVPIGISGYHPIEREAKMNIEEIKRSYGKDICLVGNVNNKTTLVSGSVEDVRREVKECIRIAAPGGGYILASDHSVHDDIPNENIFALYEAGREFGKYPICI